MEGSAIEAKETAMSINHVGELSFVKTEMERRYGLRDRHRERPDSSLMVIRRTMRRRRWEETHSGRTR